MDRDILQELKTVKANAAALKRSLDLLAVGIKDMEDQLQYTIRYLEKKDEYKDFRS